jgi:uncharacterized spore protein YtfJ
MSKQLENLISSAADKASAALKETTVLGEPTTTEGVTIIPVFKASYGFAGGGYEKQIKRNDPTLSSGAGAGVTKQPVAYITIKDGEISFININDKSKTNSSLCNTVLSLLKKEK